MIWPLLAIVSGWLLIERRRRIRLERNREQAIEAVVTMMTGTYKAVIDDMTVRFALRMFQLQQEFERQRRIDLVEQIDRGVYVHEDGQVSQIGGDVGRC